MNDKAKTEPLDVQKDRWADLLKVAGAHADEKGLKIGLEGCVRAYAKTAEDVLELAERSGAESVGAYYDPANAMAAGLDPVAEIKLFGSRLKAFHVKDTKGNHLGEGRVDFPGVDRPGLDAVVPLLVVDVERLGLGLVVHDQRACMFRSPFGAWPR